VGARPSAKSIAAATAPCNWHTPHQWRPIGQTFDAVLLPVDKNERRYARFSYFSKTEPSYIHKKRTPNPPAGITTALRTDDQRQKQRAKRKAFIAHCQQLQLSLIIEH